MSGPGATRCLGLALKQKGALTAEKLKADR